MPPPGGAAAGGTNKKACPSCGSLISAFAMRCEFCGASFVGGAVAAQKGGKGGGGGVAYSQVGTDDDNLSAIDWVLCILCSGIACILGIIYAIQGKRKGWKMVAISFAVQLIFGVIKMVLMKSASPE
jgi:hypothetical protein